MCTWQEWLHETETDNHITLIITHAFDPCTLGQEKPPTSAPANYSRLIDFERGPADQCQQTQTLQQINRWVIFARLEPSKCFQFCEIINQFTKADERTAGCERVKPKPVRKRQLRACLKPDSHLVPVCFALPRNTSFNRPKQYSFKTSISNIRNCGVTVNQSGKVQRKWWLNSWGSLNLWKSKPKT